MIRALLLALALLGAQQAALAHAVSHVDGEPKQEGQQRLCELHSAMDAVLGAMDGAAPAVCERQRVFFRSPASAPGDAGLRPPAPASRGPPSVSLK